MNNSSNNYDIYQLKLVKHTGMLLAWQSQTITITGTRQQCLEECARVQIHNFLLGWWSISSIIINPLVLLWNWYSAAKLKRLPSSEVSWLPEVGVDR